MFANSSLLPSSTNTTPTFPTTTEAPSGIAQNERIFFQTAAARGVSGIFVWLSLIITGHQVWNSLVSISLHVDGFVFIYRNRSVIMNEGRKLKNIVHVFGHVVQFLRLDLYI